MDKNEITKLLKFIIPLVCLALLLCFFYNKISKDIGVAVIREFIEGMIYDDPVPLSDVVDTNSVSFKEADTVANKKLAMEVFNEVNDVRENTGLEELRWDENLYQDGVIRAIEASTCWSHTRPDNSDWWTVDANNMYGENLGRGYDTAEEVVDAWMNSPTHKENVLYDFNTMAVGVYNSNGTYYIAQEFGY